ncbi:arylsulfatase [Yeosuana sp. MJ-SS3]|uniref:Arylsulfatase n=1 Tax=Gilvirhabdus luticola TaxID=3079858 RepID=A0ABU3U9A2_9FLAO|nr:arylsulfatase [Yeosuana sp. MJ-SS3]MDU8886978.1 arylsulfatase [Yeosuana sp. MJ-SS3]
MRIVTIKFVIAFKNAKIVISFIALFCNLYCFGQPQKTDVSLGQYPNIIYILADDLGYGDIHAYNPDGKIRTPNLDKLASDGIMFTDAHTSSAVCTPTRYGILTGRYNWRSPLKSGVLTGKSKALIPKERTTIASFLKKEGYTTAFIGKWHLGWDWAIKSGIDNTGEGWSAQDFKAIDFTKEIANGPNDLGFDYAYGHSGSLDMAPYVYVENARITQVPDKLTSNNLKYGWWREGPTSNNFIHEDVTPHFFEKAIQYIQDISKVDKPFMLYLALPSPHTPILPSENWQGKSKINPYGDFVMMIDDYVGKLLKVIENTGIENNTLVVFTSDNGCSPAADFNEMIAKGHYPSSIYRGHKADIFEGGHRVPFIVKWPDKIKKGNTSDKTICTTDFLATCADIVNIPLKDNEGEDSYSILPILLKPNSNNYQREVIIHHSINGSFAIRKGAWKMIFCPDSGGWSHPEPNSEDIENLPPFQLYNLVDDPGEKHNLFGKHLKISNKLLQLMITYIENGRSTPGKIQKNDPEGYGSKTWSQLKVFY